MEVGFLPHFMGKWADAQHRVEGAARQRRYSGFAGPSVPAGHVPMEWGGNRHDPNTPYFTNCSA